MTNKSQGMPLSIDVLSIGDDATAVWVMIKKWMSDNFNNRLPCIVEAVSDDLTTVTVRPLVMMLNTANETISRGEKQNVEVMSIGTGRAFMRFKVEAGDIGWIEASDRNFAYVIQAIKAGQDKVEQKPATLINFNWSSARFIADYMMPHSFNGDMYLGNKDSTVSIEYGPGENITLTAGGGSHAGVSRLGDEVEVTIPTGTFWVDQDAPNPQPVTVTGTITSASTTVKAN